MYTDQRIRFTYSRASGEILMSLSIILRKEKYKIPIIILVFVLFGPRRARASVIIEFCRLRNVQWPVELLQKKFRSVGQFDQLSERSINWSVFFLVCLKITSSKRVQVRDNYVEKIRNPIDSDISINSFGFAVDGTRQYYKESIGLNGRLTNVRWLLCASVIKKRRGFPNA